MFAIENIFSLPELPYSSKEEIVSILAQSENLRLERIVSCGQQSPEGFWYNQDENEWVILLKGFATIEFENNRIVELSQGDYINIPANQKHRILKTSENPECVWLAVFYK